MISGTSLMRPPGPGATMDGVPTVVHAEHAGYLRRLDAALVGPRRARRSLVTEAADHLEDATDALVGAGCHRDDAARRAVDDFGTVAEVAPGFQETLVVASSRRTAWLMLLAMIGQPFLWDKGVHLAASLEVGSSDAWGYHALDEAIELTGSLVIVGALLAMLATALGARWVRVRRPVARATGSFALGGAIVVAAECVALTAISGASPGFWAVLGLLLVLPLATVAASARQTLAAV